MKDFKLELKDLSIVTKEKSVANEKFDVLTEITLSVNGGEKAIKFTAVVPRELTAFSEEGIRKFEQHKSLEIENSLKNLNKRIEVAIKILQTGKIEKEI